MDTEAENQQISTRWGTFTPEIDHRQVWPMVTSFYDVACWGGVAGMDVNHGDWLSDRIGIVVYVFFLAVCGKRGGGGCTNIIKGAQWMERQ